MTGGRVEHYTLSIADRALRRSPGRVGMGTEFRPTERGLLGLMLGLFLDEGMERGLVSDVTAMAVEVGALPVGEGLGQSPAAAEEVPAIPLGKHGIGGIADPGDRQAISTLAEFRDGEGSGGAGCDSGAHWTSPSTASISSPFIAAVSHSWVLIQPILLRAPRSMTCAPPPKASSRGREQVNE